MATLSLYQPASAPAALAEALRHNPHRRPSPRPRERPEARLQTLRVLIVDDEPNLADMLGRLVSRWGHAPQLAYDGLAALRRAASQRPNVVLLDLDMPFVDGLQVARQLRLDFPREECFIIAFCQQIDGPCRQQCREAEIDLVFAKPVDASVVQTLLLLEYMRVNRTWADAAVSLPQTLGRSPTRSQVPVD